MNGGLPGYEYPNNSPRIRAWAAHYEAKGCAPEKAYRVACDKVARAQTWPATPNAVNGSKLSH